MWEFRRGNVFGAVLPSPRTADSGSDSGSIFLQIGPNSNDLGFIRSRSRSSITTCCCAATRVNAAVTAVFLTLQLTEILLFIGFLDSENTIKVGGSSAS